MNKTVWAIVLGLIFLAAPFALAKPAVPVDITLYKQVVVDHEPEFDESLYLLTHYDFYGKVKLYPAAKDSPVYWVFYTDDVVFNVSIIGYSSKADILFWYNFTNVKEIHTTVPPAHWYLIVVFFGEPVKPACTTEGWVASFILHEDDLQGDYAVRYFFSEGGEEIPYCKYYNIAPLGKVSP